MRHSFCPKELNTYKENFQIECSLGFKKYIYLAALGLICSMWNLVP